VVKGKVGLQFFRMFFFARKKTVMLPLNVFSFFIMFHVFILLLGPALKSTTGSFFYWCSQPAYAGTFQISDERNALCNAVS
jgi:hypothetical protein